MVLITAGKGGGTGTGGRARRSQRSEKEDRRAHGRVSRRPCRFEAAAVGASRLRIASMKDKCRSRSSSSRTRLLQVSDEPRRAQEFKMRTRRCCKVCRASRPHQTPGLINTDFDDVKDDPHGAGFRADGLGYASATGAAVTAARRPRFEPALEVEASKAHAGISFNVSGQYDSACRAQRARRHHRPGRHPDANIIVGAVIDDALGEEVRLTCDRGGASTIRG